MASRFLLSLAAIVVLATIAPRAVTRLASADGQFWDIQDTSTWSQDSGGIATGGRANPFNGFGYLKLEVRVGGGVSLVRNQYLRGFGLAYDGAERFDSISAMTGLPQVTVPAGFIGGRYPWGISLLGRLWSDRRVLSLAYSYEQATHHRRPPRAWASGCSARKACSSASGVCA